jgi:hypothetical protein
VRRLEIEPELGGGAERMGEQPGGLGCDTSLAPNELVDSLDRNANVLRESDLGLAKGNEELLA